MNFDWQTVVALVLVVLAMAYLARLAWRTFQARGGCGTCASGGCGSPSEESSSLGKEKPLVSIDLAKSAEPPVGTRE